MFTSSEEIFSDFEKCKIKFSKNGSVKIKNSKVTSELS